MQAVLSATDALPRIDFEADAANAPLGNETMVLASKAARLEFFDNSAGAADQSPSQQGTQQPAAAEIPVKDLTAPILVSLPVVTAPGADPAAAADAAKCAYLDTKDKVWKTNGCEKSSAAAGKITCACKHLTVRPLFSFHASL